MSDDTLRRITIADFALNTAPTGQLPSESPGAAPPCPHCGGAGYYTEPVPFGHPKFGVVITCVCKQAELAAREHQALLRLSNLADFQGKTFESFAAYTPALRSLLTRAQEFARRPSGWLVLFGPYGSGKTHLAVAIANAILVRNVGTIFATVPDLLDHLRSTFGPDSQIGYDEQFDRVRNAPILILDDLGTESATVWAREKLFQLINHRYNAAMPMVVTTNHRPEEIDGRILSRLSDRALGSGPIWVEAQDYRSLGDGERLEARRRAQALASSAARPQGAGGGRQTRTRS